MKKTIILAIAAVLTYSTSYSQSDSLGHERWEYILEDAGDILQLAIPITAGIMTIANKDREGTKKLFYSYATTIGLTYSLKYITKKQRPEGRERYDSFPSGHTSSAFSGASFIQRRYGSKYGIPAYILAGIVGVSRMEGPDGFHDIWDVLGGAAVGIGSTYLFTKPHQTPKVDLSFSSNNNYKVINLSYRF